MQLSHFVPQDDLYKFPNVSVCLFKKYGCDTKGLEQKCVMSNGDTEGGPTKAAFRRDEDNAQELKIRADRSKTVSAHPLPMHSETRFISIVVSICFLPHVSISRVVRYRTVGASPRLSQGSL